eukprot:3224160-Pleurochrysis_carterae.AAC.1
MDRTALRLRSSEALQRRWLAATVEMRMMRVQRGAIGRVLLATVHVLLATVQVDKGSVAVVVSTMMQAKSAKT